MGENDIHNLMPIYRYANKLIARYSWQFQFKVDTGTKENIIFFFDEFDPNHLAKFRKPHPSETWQDAKKLGAHAFCPDILDFDNKIIIEFEESQGKPRSGARLAKKGHQDDGMDAHTAERDLWYGMAGFKVLKIWDYQLHEVSKAYAYDFVWQPILHSFLHDCHLAIWLQTLPKIERQRFADK